MEELKITNPHLVEAVTFNVNTKRCNLHLRDGNEGRDVEIVYASESLDPEVHAGIMRMGLFAFAHNLTMSISWDVEKEAGDINEVERRMIRCTVEPIDDPINWSTPRTG